MWIVCNYVFSTSATLYDCDVILDLFVSLLTELRKIFTSKYLNFAIKVALLCYKLAQRE